MSPRLFKTTSRLLLLLVAGLCFHYSLAQAQPTNFLQKKISVQYSKTKLIDALIDISNKGGFIFSYSGKLIPQDSLVTLEATDQAVATILSKLIKGNLQFEQQKNHIIITPVLPQLSLIHTDITNDDHSYSISGIVVNEQTRERIVNASVYEKRELVSTLTDRTGYFKLKFKTATPSGLNITVGKFQYRDTTVNFLQQVDVNTGASSKYNKASAGLIESDGFSKFFLSTRQKIQSLNIPDFFANRPVQVSLSPGLSTHGLMSSQVVNMLSVNLAGGYTAGVNGIEVGGLFNMNKRDSKYLQLAGVFNLVGGTSSGFELAGVSNKVLKDVNGLQIAGFMNMSKGTVKGMQLSGLHNEAHQLKGLQIGFLNVADTSFGASLGVINIIRNGFYRVSYSANTLMNTNISLATGTHRFYSKLIVGAHVGGNYKMSGFGMGVGHDFMFGSKLYASTEASYIFANTEVWADRWMQGKLLLNVQVAPKMSVFAGPSYNLYKTSMAYDGRKINHRLVNESNNVYSKWIGWEAGIAYNSVFKASPAVVKDSRSWFLGFGPTLAIAIDYHDATLTGLSVHAQKDFSERLSATFTIDYIKTNLNIPDYPYWPDYVVSARYKDYSMVPVMLGIRSYLNNTLFFGGEVGGMMKLNSVFEERNTITGEITNRLYDDKFYYAYAASMGFSLKNGFEPSIKFEHLVNNIPMIQLKLAYRIRLCR
jgi:hypothetical protein